MSNIFKACFVTLLLSMSVPVFAETNSETQIPFSPANEHLLINCIGEGQSVQLESAVQTRMDKIAEELANVFDVVTAPASLATRWDIEVSIANFTGTLVLSESSQGAITIGYRPSQFFAEEMQSASKLAADERFQSFRRVMEKSVVIAVVQRSAGCTFVTADK